VAALKWYDTSIEADREVYANLILEALGCTAVALARVDETTVIYEFVHGTPGWDVDDFTAYDSAEGSKEIALLDWLIDNRDRHEGNWIATDDETVVPIDHDDATFTPHAPGRDLPSSGFSEHWLGLRTGLLCYRSPVVFSGRARLTAEELRQLRPRLLALRPRFESRPDWFTAIIRRLDYLQQHLPEIG
jgi:hypothetical protein